MSEDPTHDRQLGAHQPRNGDPTANVLDLVDAAVQRQDDLRAMEDVWRNRMDVTRVQHDRELRKAEADRIDAIRAVDVGQVQSAAKDRAAEQAALAAQVTISAETLRTTVASAAAAAATSLAAALGPIQKDIAELRKVQYETAGGKAQTVETRDVSGSRGLWVGVIVTFVIGAGGILLTGLTIVLATRGR